jgi:hypothetical protein
MRRDALGLVPEQILTILVTHSGGPGVDRPPVPRQPVVTLYSAIFCRTPSRCRDIQRVWKMGSC